MTRIHRTANRIYSELRERSFSFYSDLKFILQKSKTPAKAQGGDPDDIRLIGAATPVILLAALIFGFAYTSRFAPILSLATDQELIAQMRKERGNIDPVLIEQPEYLERRTQQRSVLSDQTSEGRGGITTLYGFHTLTDSDRLQLGQGDGGSPATPGSRPQPTDPNRLERTETDRPGDTMPEETAAHRADNACAQTAGTGDGGGRRMRIPTNYRFQEQLRLR
ncbi:MAG: hypothetical protein KDK34_20015, partial [Leptospiraceae bacterium]|nr:hypothetical protein [Leptospiraceae bacterium]